MAEKPIAKVSQWAGNTQFLESLAGNAEYQAFAHAAQYGAVNVTQPMIKNLRELMSLNTEINFNELQGLPLQYLAQKYDGIRNGLTEKGYKIGFDEESGALSFSKKKGDSFSVSGDGVISHERDKDKIKLDTLTDKSITEKYGDPRAITGNHIHAGMNLYSAIDKKEEMRGALADHTGIGKAAAEIMQIAGATEFQVNEPKEFKDNTKYLWGNYSTWSEFATKTFTEGFAKKAGNAARMTHDIGAEVQQEPPQQTVFQSFGSVAPQGRKSKKRGLVQRMIDAFRKTVMAGGLLAMLNGMSFAADEMDDSEDDEPAQKTEQPAGFFKQPEQAAAAEPDAKAQPEPVDIGAFKATNDSTAPVIADEAPVTATVIQQQPAAPITEIFSEQMKETLTPKQQNKQKIMSVVNKHHHKR